MKAFKLTGTVSLVVLSAISLAACSGAKEQLGLTKKTPDEFAVVKRAPLAMPPDYSLRPPQPGAPRPQEQSPQEQARDTVFGTPQDGTAAAASTGPDATLLTKAGAINSDPGIRQKVDAETREMNKDAQPTIKKMLGMDNQTQAPASVVNAKQETERLKQNQQTGKPVTSGNTPAVEQ